MRIHNLLLIIAAMVTAFAFTGCYYDTEEELYGTEVCDTTNTTYSGFIKPLMDAKCVNCHSGASPSGQIDLSTYAAIKAQADNGKLYGSIAQLSGYKPMPQGGKLSNCDISKVKIWVDRGAPQN